MTDSHACQAIGCHAEAEHLEFFQTDRVTGYLAWLCSPCHAKASASIMEPVAMTVEEWNARLDGPVNGGDDA